MNKCDGIKILELDPKRILEGNEYMVIAEKDQNFKAPINQIVDLVVSDDRLKNYIDTTIESSIGDFKNEVNQSISELTSKINNLDSKITTVNNRITNLESSIDDIEQSITSINNRITNLESSIDDIEQNITSINNKITSIENNLGNVGELLDEEYITQLVNRLISENKISVLDPVQQAMNKGTGVTLALPSANSGKISLPIWTGTEAEYNQLTKVAGMTYNIIDEESE